MDLYIYFLLRFGFKNKVLKPYHAVLNLSRGPFTQDKNLITLFTKHYHLAYVELRLFKHFRLDIIRINLFNICQLSAVSGCPNLNSQPLLVDQINMVRSY